MATWDPNQQQRLQLQALQAAQMTQPGGRSAGMPTQTQPSPATLAITQRVKQTIPTTQSDISFPSQPIKAISGSEPSALQQSFLASSAGLEISPFVVTDAVRGDLTNAPAGFCILAGGGLEPIPGHPALAVRGDLNHGDWTPPLRRRSGQCQCKIGIKVLCSKEDVEDAAREEGDEEGALQKLVDQAIGKRADHEAAMTASKQPGMNPSDVKLGKTQDRFCVVFMVRYSCECTLDIAMQYRSLAGWDAGIKDILGPDPDKSGTQVRMQDGEIRTVKYPNEVMKWNDQVWISDAPEAVRKNQVPPDKRGKVGAGGCVVVWTDCPSVNVGRSWIVVAKATSTNCTPAVSIVQFDYHGDGEPLKRGKEENQESKPKGRRR